MIKGQFISDDELREAGVPEVHIDALNFDPRTQKGMPTRLRTNATCRRSRKCWRRAA